MLQALCTGVEGGRPGWVVGASMLWSISFRNSMWPISVIVLNIATNIPSFPPSFGKLDNFFSWRKCFLEEELWAAWFYIETLDEIEDSKGENEGLGGNRKVCYNQGQWPHLWAVQKIQWRNSPQLLNSLILNDLEFSFQNGFMDWLSPIILKVTF